jgi:Putative mono-oxygenase ydhR
MSNVWARKQLFKVAIFTLLLMAFSLTAIFVAAQDAATEATPETRSDSMSPIVLQINYHFSSTPAEHIALCNQVAAAIAATPGLIWKTWLMNEADHEAGGIYLFESREEAEAYLSGPIITALGSNPTISDVSAKMFTTNEGLDLITRAPLTLPASA